MASFSTSSAHGATIRFGSFDVAIDGAEGSLTGVVFGHPEPNISDRAPRIRGATATSQGQLGPRRSAATQPAPRKASIAVTPGATNKGGPRRASPSTVGARSVALLHAAKYQQAMRRYHDRNVKSRTLQVGDLVLRRVQSNKGRHKLSPPWEGPFIVDRVLRPGTVKLKDEDGRPISNAWNIEQLRRFFP